MKRNITLTAVLLAAVLLVSAPAFVSAQSGSTAGSGNVLQSMQSSLRGVTQKILPAVVEINVTEAAPQTQSRSPFGGVNPRGQGGTVSALGSGIIVRHTGDRYYVLTNNHVIDGATSVSIKLSDGRSFTATVVGKDSLKDLGMVSFTTNDTLPLATLADSDTLQVGDLVIAVGNPLGFESTVTMGIVSALGRRGPDTASNYTDYIQTDAAINEGNSGGPLVNIDGQVVGINTWIAAPSGGSIGLGFAIPINSAKTDLESFVAGGSVQYGWLGVSITDVQNAAAFADTAKDLKLQGVKGALVVDVYKGSPAYNAGLFPGDFVTAVDATAIASSSQLTQLVGGLVAGRTYQFTVQRYGAKVTFPVKIAARNQDITSLAGNLWPGMTVVDISDQVRQQAGIQPDVQGVVVVDVTDQNDAAAAAGLQPGDVISSINAAQVRNVLDFYKALNGAKGTVTLNVNREGTDGTVTLTR
jgi:Do/DeqQ family serine protease